MRYIMLFVLIVLNCLLLAGSFIQHEHSDNINDASASGGGDLVFTVPQEEFVLELKEGVIVYFDGKKFYTVMLEELKKP